MCEDRDTVDGEGFRTKSTEMHHLLLRATPLLAALLSIWTTPSIATPPLRNSLDPVARIVYRQQDGGPQALTPSYAYRRSPPSTSPSALGKRNVIHVLELSSNFLLHYSVFTTFAPSWPTASWLAEFWFRLASHLLEVPDQSFHEQNLQFSWGPLRLEFFNAGDNPSSIPRHFIIAFANTMVGYAQRGFCGTFNARLSDGGSGGGDASGVKIWITFRIVEGLGEAAGL